MYTATQKRHKILQYAIGFVSLKKRVSGPKLVVILAERPVGSCNDIYFRTYFTAARHMFETFWFLFLDTDLIASAGAYNSASQTVGIQCNRGQKVCVKTSQGGTMFNMYGWRTSTFTGYMVAYGGE